MKLYHYAAAQFTELQTRRKRGGLSFAEITQAVDHAKHIHDPGAYIDHLSLFIEPIPKTTIAQIFKGEHPFWEAGKQIYEHVIETEDLPINVLWSLVETPEIDKFTDRFDWSVKDKVTRTGYLVAMNEEMVKRGFTNRGVLSLTEKLQPYLGKTEAFYINARTKSDALATKNQYAAYVPHLMIYPNTGRIRIRSVQAITLGFQQPKKSLAQSIVSEWG